jgi:tellurite resistance protein
MRIAASWDNFSVFLLLMTYFFMALLGVMYKSFTQLKYFMSWWAFTFPLAAATIASAVAFQVTQFVFFKIMAWASLFTAVTAIVIVAWFTIKHIRKGEICVKED